MRADPDVVPGRRDRESADPLEELDIVSATAVRVVVSEAAPLPAAPQPGPGTTDVAKPHLATRQRTCFVRTECRRMLPRLHRADEDSSMLVYVNVPNGCPMKLPTSTAPGLAQA
jgi:hypothetical protein